MSKILMTYEDWIGAVIDLTLNSGDFFDGCTVEELWMSTAGVPSQMRIRTRNGYGCVVPWHAVAQYACPST